VSGLRAGAAAVSLEPPLGLPMVGFVRRYQPAQWSAGDLEATAVVLEAGGVRAAVIGVDTIAIQSPVIEAIRARVAQAIGCSTEAVLVNFNHTHCAPPASPKLMELGGGGPGDAAGPEVAAYAQRVHAAIVDVARLAASRLEAARPTWGVGRCDESVNRRERHAGRVILGWNPDGMVDPQVPVLQLQRPDGGVIATVVGFGCHTVAVGPDVLAYSADYAGPMRDAVRTWTGGECVFLQGAAGNVLPRVAFADSLEPARRMGRRLALAALDAVADRPAWGRTFDRFDDGSVTPFHLYRPRAADAGEVALAATQIDVAFPLQEVPTLQAVEAELAAVEARLADAQARGADGGELNVIRYDAVWARIVADELRAGLVSDRPVGAVCALRVGDGAIVTGPGEIFSEIGLAVRERSPAEVTLYAGYTNGLLTYFPSAAAYPHGGYEPTHGNRSFGLAAQVTPEADGLLVRAGVDALAELFDTPRVSDTDSLLASGALPAPPPPLPAQRPSGG
jgi:hypothetical protein